MINWLKKDEALLELIKLGKEELDTKPDDIKALTKFLYYSIVRQEKQKQKDPVVKLAYIHTYKYFHSRIRLFKLPDFSLNFSIHPYIAIVQTR